MEKEAKKGSSDGKKKGSGAGAGTGKFALKFLAPEALAGAIVGRQGTRIAAMREKFGAGVQLTDRSETYPGTDCRPLTLQCDTQEKLLDLAKHILGIQLDLTKPEEIQKNKSPPTIIAETLGKDGDLKVALLVPRASAGGIIGKGGATIKQLRETSGVKKLVIGEALSQEPGADQMVSIIGPLGAVETVLHEVSKQVQALQGEGWFGAWVAAGVPAQTAQQDHGSWGHGGSGWDDWGSSWDDGWHGGWNDGWDGGWSDGRGGGRGSADTLLTQVAREMPVEVLEDSRGFAMSCTVPRRLTGGLIGRRGSNIQMVKDRTSTEVSVRPIPEDPDHSTLNIVGPLPDACAAYMLMMKLYLDAEEAGS